MAFQGHSRSRILGSVERPYFLRFRRRTDYRSVVWSPLFTEPIIVWRPIPREPQRISPQTLYRRKLESLAYILPLIVWVCLHSNICSGLWKTHLFCNRVRIGCSRSSKVVDFGVSRKGACDFLLVVNSNFSPILHRFWDTAIYWLKIANFCEFLLPHSHLTPSLEVNPTKFLGQLFIPKTIQSLGKLGYPSVNVSWS